MDLQLERTMIAHSSIKKLPDNVINQIKAGEVVERPLNVVKELVENSLDAKASEIKVEMLDGGKRLIQITDNGIGIERDQIKLATQRHTTSKLKLFEDLQSLKSFGFRGEALASIVSVSQFVIKTKTESDELGIEVNFASTPFSSQEITMSQGTMISVKDLFYNVPARLKFLRSTATEFSLIYEFLRAVSLSFPKTAFQLVHNGRTVFDYKPKKNLKDRFQEVMLLEADKYVKVDFSHGSFKLSGYTALPTEVKSTQNRIITFVNDRFIKDRFIRSSVYDGYQGLLMKGMKPSSTLFITIDPKMLDINAHPSKTEVRFFDPLLVQDLISRGIENAIKTNINKRIEEKSHSSSTLSVKSQEPTLYNRTPRYPNLAHLSSPLKNHHDYNKGDRSFNHRKIEQSQRAQTEIFNSIEQKKHAFSNVEYLGQFLKCYLLFESGSELLVIDQHAFHERVLFEEIKCSYEQNGIQKQLYLNPTILQINSTFSNIYIEQKQLISKLGFEIEVLKDKTLAIHSAPTFLKDKYVESLFLDLSQNLFDEKILDQTKLYHTCFATLACHSAIRSGEPLSTDFIHKLLNRAADVDFFAHCPHGRPVIRKFSKNDVERWFERI